MLCEKSSVTFKMHWCVSSSISLVDWWFFSQYNWYRVKNTSCNFKNH